MENGKLFRFVLSAKGLEYPIPLRIQKITMNRVIYFLKYGGVITKHDSLLSVAGALGLYLDGERRMVLRPRKWVNPIRSHGYGEDYTENEAKVDWLKTTGIGIRYHSIFRLYTSYE